jgi:uncharacterized protein
MNTIRAIIDNYEKLCRYCDAFFSSMKKTYGDHMRCGPGCSACCELHSVCSLEAHVIVTKGGIKREGHAAPPRNIRRHCAMLVDDRCTIYAVRPIICRTHGLAISYDNGRTVYSSCNLNFTDQHISSLSGTHVFDAAAITGNLMRLNMAFCTVSGDRRRASERVTMGQILYGTVQKCIL